jgi:ATP:ADP antiporter, AAA family
MEETAHRIPSRIVRFISRTLGIERGEFAAVAWSFTYFFCILSSYYILRPVRDMMAVESGPETIPWLFVGTFVTMLLATPVFGWIASRYPRKRFLPWVYYFFILNILIFWAAFSHAISQELDFVWLSRMFFVWISVFNLYVVTVFWSFMADLYTRDQCRRLFGIIAAGGSIGALLSGIATRTLVIPIGFQNLLPISAAILLLATFCIARLRHWVEREDREEKSATLTSERPLGGSPLAGVTQVLQSKYFVGIAISTAIATLLGTALYMFAAELVEDAIINADERTQFFSDINVATNALALIGQLLIVKHVVKRFGLGVSLSLLPVVSVAGFALLAFDPSLALVAILTVIRRALGFGFSKPTSDMLYSVVTPEQKYKAKNFIDTVLYRSGDVVGTWVVRFMYVGLGLGMAMTSLVMLPFAMIWAALAIWLGREYKQRDKEISINA